MLAASCRRALALLTRSIEFGLSTTKGTRHLTATCEQCGVHVNLRAATGSRSITEVGSQNYNYIPVCGACVPCTRSEKKMELLVGRLSTLADNPALLELSASVETVFADMIEFECVADVSIPPLVFSKVRKALLLLSANDGEHQRSIGRPKFDIPYDLLVQLLELGFTITAIADIISVSRSTVNRRMREYGLSASMKYSNITDIELDHAVQSVSHAHPGCGHKMMQGHLIQRGIRVQQ